MGRAISITSKLVGFAILFIVFHFTLGSNAADMIYNYSASYAQVKGEKLSPIVSNSLYITTDDFSSIYSNGEGSLLSNTTGVSTVDPRVLAMRQFLVAHYSPLYPYAETFVKEADKYGLDWRLVASISGVESAFGNLTPYRSNNGWGWRGGPGGAYSIFNSWNDGIRTVTSRLALGYGTTLTPFQIEPVYCPPCGANPQHAWANGVTRFMNELQFYVENLENIY